MCMLIKTIDKNALCDMQSYFFLVGAGTAGSILASRLSEVECVNVLLLEAGGEPPLISEVPALARLLLFSHIDWKYKTVPQKYTGDQLKNRVNMH